MKDTKLHIYFNFTVH